MGAAFGAAGAIQYTNGTSIGPDYPTGITAGQGMLLIIASKADDATSSPGTGETGWVDLGSATLAAADSPAATGNDVGPVKVRFWWKVATAAHSGAPNFNLSSNVSWGQIIRFTKTKAGWATPVLLGGFDNAGGTSWSVNCGSGELAAGDLLAEAIVIPTDVNPTWGAFTHTQSGTTVGAPTLIGTASTTTQRDLGGRSQYAAVTAGGGSGTLTVTSTLSGTTGNSYGAMGVVRLRDADPPATPPAPSVAPGPEYVAVTMPSDDPSVTQYDLRRNGALAFPNRPPGEVLNDASSSVVATQVYSVSAENAVGSSAVGPNSTAVAADPKPPQSWFPTPGNAEVTINITRRAYAAKYKVYRGPAGGARTLVHTSTTQVAGGTYQFVDTGLANGTEYDYHVTTEAQTPTVRESSASTILSATPAEQTIPISAGGDDGEATSAGTLSKTANEISVGATLSGVASRGYFRFPGLQIDQGSTILGAHLELSVFAADAVGVTAYAIDADTTAEPAVAADITSAALTTANATISAASGSAVRRVNVTAVLQEVVNRPGWTSGNAVTFVLETDGTLDAFVDFYSFESVEEQAKLSLTVESGEVHTTSGSATGIRSVTAATSKTAITAANATGVRSTTFTTSKTAITAANATGVRSTTVTVSSTRPTSASATGVRSTTVTSTSTRTTTGQMVTVHSVTSETDSFVPEIHTTTGSAPGVRSTTAVTAKFAISTGDAAGVRSTTSASTKRAITSANVTSVHSVTVFTQTERLTAMNASATRGVSAVTAKVGITAANATGVRSTTFTIASTRTIAADATATRSTTRTGSSTRTTAGQMVSVHSVLAEVVGNGEQHPTTGTATGVRSTLSTSSKVAITIGDAQGTRSTTSTATRVAGTIGSAQSVQAVSFETTTLRSTASNAPHAHAASATVATTKAAVGGPAQAQRGVTATTSTSRATGASANLILDTAGVVSTTRVSQGQTLVVLSTTYVIGIVITWDVGFEGTAALDTFSPGTALITATADASAIVEPAGTASATVQPSAVSTAQIVVVAPATASAEPAGPATAILEPTAASTATITRE